MNNKTLTILTVCAGLLAPAAITHAGEGCSTCSSKSSMASYAKKDMNVVQKAMSKEQFSTLVAAVKAAGLAETLSGEGPFTIFAPTNDAFAALPEGTVETLLKPENREQLQSILTYHVVPGKIMAADVQPTLLETVNGQNVRISVKDGTVMVDGAKVIATDITASNGVIHVIDSVIMPKATVAANMQ